MHVPKSAVTEALRKQGDHDRAQQAECQLPRHVDTVRDANLLHRFGVDVRDLEAVEAGGP
ncbi:MAG TPA: hypothetical protein VER39_04360 [Nocardioidaceae bacterium]|nr:hypothetical protein [Nocardioidaceae bacterium]